MEDRLLANDLYNYLVSLSSVLGGIGEADAAKRVLHVSKFAAGSTSELYGEARRLLPAILREHGGSLTNADRSTLAGIIAGIEREFGRIGGA